MNFTKYIYPYIDDFHVKPSLKGQKFTFTLEAKGAIPPFVDQMCFDTFDGQKSYSHLWMAKGAFIPSASIWPKIRMHLWQALNKKLQHLCLRKAITNTSNLSSSIKILLWPYLLSFILFIWTLSIVVFTLMYIYHNFERHNIEQTRCA